MQRDVKRVHKSQWFGPSLDPSYYGKTRKTAGGAQCAPPLVIGLTELHIIVRTTGIYLFIISHEVIECLWNILLHLTVWLFRHCRNALDPLLDWLSYPLTTMATWSWSWFIMIMFYLAYTSGQSSPHQVLLALTTPTAVNLPLSFSCRAPPESPCPCSPPMAHRWKSLDIMISRYCDYVLVRSK